MTEFLKEDAKKRKRAPKDENTIRLESMLIDLLNHFPCSFWTASMTIPLLDEDLKTVASQLSLYNRLREIHGDDGTDHPTDQTQPPGQTQPQPATGHYSDEDRGKALFAIYLLAETKKLSLLNLLAPGATLTTEDSLKTEILNAAALLYGTAALEKQRVEAAERDRQKPFFLSY